MARTLRALFGSTNSSSPASPPKRLPADPYQRPRHGKRTGLEIDVRPAQAQCLAAAKPQRLAAAKPQPDGCTVRGLSRALSFALMTACTSWGLSSPD